MSFAQYTMTTLTTDNPLNVRLSAGMELIQAWEEPPAAPWKERAEPRRRVTGVERRRILVVDDNPAILDNWRRVLSPARSNASLDSLEAELFGGGEEKPEEESFEVETATQGEEGYVKVVRALEEGVPFALAIVDMRMPPGWDGLETLARMLERDPELEVAICSAYADHTRLEVEQRVKRAEVPWLAKPFKGSEVLAVARELSARCILRRSGSFSGS